MLGCLSCCTVRLLTHRYIHAGKQMSSRPRVDDGSLTVELVPGEGGARHKEEKLDNWTHEEKANYRKVGRCVQIVKQGSGV